MKICCLQNYEFNFPIFETHDKFNEAWYFLCSMAECYHDAKRFRWYLNAFIQALRNVTFMLQSEKSKIENFESWYPSKQNEMKNNKLLLNFREGRNIIVKQRMLKTRSTACVGVFRGYQLKIGIDRLNLSPFADSTQLLELAKSRLIPHMLDKKHSAIGEQIGIKRTWIVEEIGDEEILGLCYNAWREIGKFVSEAHKILQYEFKCPDFNIENLEEYTIILESDIDPSLPEKWGWI